MILYLNFSITTSCGSNNKDVQLKKCQQGLHFVNNDCAHAFMELLNVIKINHCPVFIVLRYDTDLNPWYKQMDIVEIRQFRFCTV